VTTQIEFIWISIGTSFSRRTVFHGVR